MRVVPYPLVAGRLIHSHTQKGAQLMSATTVERGNIIHLIRNSGDVTNYHNIEQCGGKHTESLEFYAHDKDRVESMYFRTDDPDTIRVIVDAGIAALNNVKARKEAAFEADRSAREDVILEEYGEVSKALQAVRAERFEG